MIINWKPKKNNELPLHIQIFNYFKKRISNGRWINGEKLPSQRELVKVLGVNRSTVVKAMEELKLNGYISTNGKAGSFVSNNSVGESFYSKEFMIDNMLKTGILKRNNKIYVEIEKYSSEKMINLGIGELNKELYPKETMKKIINEVVEETEELNYGNNRGDESLIKNIEKMMEKLSIDMSENKILITSGSNQGIFISIFGLLSKNSSIKAKLPSYLKSLEIFNTPTVRVEMLENSCNNNIIYTIPTFQNPTGKLMSSFEREVFVNKYASINPIIEDDVFREIWFDNEPPKPLKSYSNKNIIYINSFSKSLFPGLGIGWICANNHIIEKLSEIKKQINSGTSVLNQKIASKWLESGEFHENTIKIRKALKIRRDMVEEILQRDFSEYFTWTKPSGGYFYWLKLKNKVKGFDIFKEALKKGVIIYPGELFGEKYIYHIRLCFAKASIEELEKGMKILLEILGGEK